MTEATLNYIHRTDARPRYYANDHSRDVLPLDPRRMTIEDARISAPSLDVEGFALIPHRSAVTDFTDASAVWSLHRGEIAALIQRLSGADAVHVTAPGILRYGERSALAGTGNNSWPARFIHVDITDTTAAAFAAQSAHADRTVRRHAHYNIWRAISTPPQDVPLGVCDARSVAVADLIEADAIFDEPGKPEWAFAGWVLAHNPAHRWHWFSDMTPGEALVFKTNDSLASAPHCVPHSAFDNADCPPGAAARVSIEMRATAFWYG
jgi:hypothetical protein